MGPTEPSARVRRALSCAQLLLACAVLSPVAVHAEPDPGACLSAHVRGQEERLAGHFVAARTELARCAEASCHSLVRADCATWLGELAAQTPSLEVVVVDGQGAPLADARVSVDGLVRATGSLAPVPLDRGSHTLAVAAPGHATFSRTLALADGQRELVRVMLAPAVAQPVRVRRSQRAGYVLGGLAVAAAAFAGVERLLLARSMGRLERCDPACSDAAVDQALGRFRAMWGAAGSAGGLALGSAVSFTVAQRARALHVAPSLQVGAGGLVLGAAARF